ncbi:MAG: iron-containing alcohol dehydrogenase [Candidatus Humimicrobiaceae bacterium]
METILFEEVEAKAEHEMVNREGKLVQSQKCDVSVGLGGGRAVNTAKEIALIAKENVDIWEIACGRKISNGRKSLTLVPTTTETGSEATQYTVISNRKLKKRRIC